MAYLSIKDPGPNKLRLLSKLRSFFKGLSVGDLTRLVNGEVETHLAKPPAMSEIVWSERLDTLADLLDDQGAEFDLDECGCDIDEADELTPWRQPSSVPEIVQAVAIIENDLRRGNLKGLGGMLN